MAIHWQIKFRSLRSNILFTANVYDDDYSGDPVQLTGAAVPFETQEDDSDDPFEPVRTQSGYLRIVDTGEDNDGNTFDWRTFIPTTDTDRPVTLTNEDGTVLWMGFMQAQNFGARLYDTPQEREFPLQCPLTVTSRYNNTYYKQDYTQNFAFLLKTVVDSIPYVCRPASIVIQGGSDAQTWLLKKIDWQLFFEENTDWEATTQNTGFEGEPQPRYSLYDCFEGMCRYWGWTARTNGQFLFLTCVDASDVTGFLTLTYDQLSTMASGTAAGSVDDSAGFVPAGFASDIYASADNQDFQMRGPNASVVKADMGAGDSDVIKCFSDGVLSRLLLYGFGITDPNNHYAINSQTSIETSLLKATGGTGADFSVLNPSGVVAYSSEYTPIIRIKQAYDGTVLASLESKKVHCFTDGTITIKGKAYKNYNPLEAEDEYTPEIGTKFMVMRIGIGMTRATAKWFRGKASYGGYGFWDYSEVTCRGRLGGSGDTIWVSPMDNTPPVNMLSSIPTDGNTFNTVVPMYGKIFIDFLGSEDSDLTTFDIAEFKVEYRRNKKMWRWVDTEKHDSHDYKSFNDNNVEEEWSDDTFFATENNSVFGYGVILNTDYSYFEGYGYGGSSSLTTPEQHLANRVTNYWATSKRKMKCKLRTDKVIELTPKVKGTIDGTTVWPLSVSRNWRDDTEEVIFIEVI